MRRLHMLIWVQRARCFLGKALSRKMWMRATLGVAALLAACFAILVLRTMLTTSRQVVALRADPAKLDEKGAVERFAASLRYKTISNPAEFDPEAFRGLHRHLEESFPRVHQSLKREVVEEFSLLYHWTGTDRDAAPILLMSHLDVVGVPRKQTTSWTH